MTPKKYLFTSESVTEGHPDKIADQISDSILDELIRQDKYSRVAVETLVTTGLAFVAGEVTTNGYVDVQHIVRETVKDIGYDFVGCSFYYDNIGVVTAIHEQSPDIAIGVDERNNKEQGAGDQGLMFGYAIDETDTLMPLPIYYAHRLARRLAEVRKKGILDYIRPDGKTQVTVEYENGTPIRIDTIVVSTMHKETVSFDSIRDDIIENVVKPVVPEGMLDGTRYFINPTGRFVIGGPRADTGLTGRKIIVDTYGGQGSHGGGCFSGKDPSKVDRSASYMVRHIAKNIVAAGLARQCEVQLAYAIGVAEPVSVMVNTYGTNTVDEEKIENAISDVFDLRPKAIIEYLDLLRPIFRKTSVYGHFGREEEEFTWEKTNRVDDLRTAVGL
ncbi:MAG: methionine adenosyltransferase [Candidatus Coatesbacteria bacterium]|nr:MAG: methionine adenosyltransferase [Candidatus Coatesbacteria bacterium]RLC43525.1 MAG: methionine adenosyltransferase [Candidatus Coatesbacteria bacterium]RLC43544.1 MAG: methionine adenosyltransferase [Candidatus Coatesbacteria bacterium]HEC79788.1 methionine adenosyltransferase [Bacillota bacterium]